MKNSGKNKHGLSRTIPLHIKKDVRRRSKFGCVVCRSGIYQYEHIDPEFKDAKKHDPNKICCLCGSCHDKVTRGQWSKETINANYHEIQRSENVQRPTDFFDFRSSNTKLKFGNLIMNCSPKIVFKCYDSIIFSIEPGSKIETGKISAIFSDEFGKKVFEIKHNEWIGPTSLYDLEIVKNIFKLRLPSGKIALQLRLNPPSEVIIEKLDMRYRDIHLLISDKDIAIGRYTGYENNLIWLHVKARIDSVFKGSTAISVNEINASAAEYQSGISLLKPRIAFSKDDGLGQVMNIRGGRTDKIDSQKSGIYWPTMGINIAEGCNYSIGALVGGVCSIEHAQKYFFKANRLNSFSYALPPKVTMDQMNEENKNSRRDDNRNLKDFDVPFLLKKDKKALEEWNDRQMKENSCENLIDTPFIDNEPGDYFSGGIIKLVDNYNQAASKIRKTGIGEFEFLEFLNQSFPIK